MEQKVSLCRFCRNTGAGSFQESEGWVFRGPGRSLCTLNPGNLGT